MEPLRVLPGRHARLGARHPLARAPAACDDAAHGAAWDERRHLCRGHARVCRRRRARGAARWRDARRREPGVPQGRDHGVCGAGGVSRGIWEPGEFVVVLCCGGRAITGAGRFPPRGNGSGDPVLQGERYRGCSGRLGRFWVEYIEQ